MFNILIFDEKSEIIADMLKILKYAGYRSFPVFHHLDALNQLDSQNINLILWNPATLDARQLSIAEQMRNCSPHSPILLFTDRQFLVLNPNPFLRQIDDFILKPVQDAEILLRIKALLQRSGNVYDQQLHIGDVILNYNALTATRAEEKYILPRKEFYILYRMLSNPDKIFTRTQLMDEIWGMDSNTVSTTVNVHINRLRNRFAHWPEFEIITIRGMGYKASLK